MRALTSARAAEQGPPRSEGCVPLPAACSVARAGGKARSASGGGHCLYLHVHDVGVGLHHAVAHVQRGLKTDLGLLYGHHGFFQAHRGVL